MMEYFHATLRVLGPTVDPEAITKIVGFAPTQSFRVGDVFATRSPSGPHTRKHGFWGFTTQDDKPDNFSRRLLELIRRIPPGVLVDDLAGQFQVEVFVGLFGIRDQSTLTIDAEVHRELGLRGWPLVFDMYVEGAHAEDPATDILPQ